MKRTKDKVGEGNDADGEEGVHGERWLREKILGVMNNCDICFAIDGDVERIVIAVDGDVAGIVVTVDGRGSSLLIMEMRRNGLLHVRRATVRL
ncbi:hypothetical protein L1049_018215 [Liquidambar formosana]|uniref:Uncharacterized protein n=1 Tax=Liquidambar formosana TaxID=63359 RepID=A0AAP0R9R3_LIQFO